MHTSRDILVIASQLVSMWVELFHKGKAKNGAVKLLRQTIASESLKVRSKVPISGKPSQCMASEALDGKGNLQVPSTTRTHSPSRANNKKFDNRIAKLEPLMDTNSESSCSQRIIQGTESKLMSEEAAAAFGAAEAARAAVLKAAEVPLFLFLSSIRSYSVFSFSVNILVLPSTD